MAALKTHRFGTLDDVNAFLRGDIIGGSIADAVYGIATKTLIFTTPAATVTFATTNDAEQEALTPREIAAQIEAQIGAGFTAKVVAKNRIFVGKDSPTTGVVLGGTGTGNVLCGFAAGGKAGVKYADPAGTPPKLVSIASHPDYSQSFFLVTEE